MAERGIEVLGLDEVVAMLTDVPIKANTAVRRAVATLARQARDEVKAATPVDTGALKRSIAVASSRPRGGLYSYRVIARQNGGRTGQGYHYHLVEYGTRHMAARHFAAPIKQKYTGSGGAQRLEDAIRTVIDNAVLKQQGGK